VNYENIVVFKIRKEKSAGKCNSKKFRIDTLQLVNKFCKNDKGDYGILYEIYFNHTSIHKLAKKLSISRATIRYRGGRALEKLK